MERKRRLGPAAWIALLLVCSWLLVVGGLIGRWPVSFLAIPLLGGGILWTMSRRNWVGAAVLIVLNPLGVIFLWGVGDYLRGRPYLRFVGLPRMESYNIDPGTRCLRDGGGCLLSGNEWAFLVPYNGGVVLMAKLLGPPANGYDGPYPTKDEALAAVASGRSVDLSDLLLDRVVLDETTCELPLRVGETIVEGLLGPLPEPEEQADANSPWRVQAHAVLWNQRCLILRIQREATESDCLVLLDRTKGLPFAYFAMGRPWVRFPPVRYDKPPPRRPRRLVADGGRAGRRGGPSRGPGRHDARRGDGHQRPARHGRARPAVHGAHLPVRGAQRA